MRRIDRSIYRKIRLDNITSWKGKIHYKAIWKSSKKENKWMKYYHVKSFSHQDKPTHERKPFFRRKKEIRKKSKKKKKG